MATTQTYKCISNNAPIKSKASLFASNLGTLKKDALIEVISISGSWAYFKYNNKNAYILTMYIQKFQTVVTGSVTIRYLNTDTKAEVASPIINSNLSLKSYTYTAPAIANYTVVEPSTKSVVLSETNPNQEIIFYYKENKIYGSITINYIDKDTGLSIAPSETYNNIELGTYSYNSIDITGYKLSSVSSQSVTLTKDTYNQSITFLYSKILGTIYVKYMDVDTKTEISTAESYSNLELKAYSYKAKSIDGYTVVEPSSKTVTLTTSDYNQNVVFYYKANKVYGSVAISYIEKGTNISLSPSITNNNLELGTYSYNSIDISGYQISSEASKSVTLTKEMPNQSITFEYTKILGSVSIKYIDSDTNKEIVPSETHDKLELGTYSYSALDISGYQVSGDSNKSITLTSDNPNQTVSFEYTVEKATDPLDPSKQNEVPYISTYYIKPIVKPNEEVIIDYYITDYYHKEYVSEDFSETFTVTVRIEGKDDIVVKNLKAGDQSISLGTFPKLDGQEQKFSILCTDQYGRNSHELFNFFLVRNDVPVKEYVMTTDDLTTYSISNTNDTTKIAATRQGLQKLLDDKQAQGFNKLRLLAGTYRIDHLAPIYIPTKFTLDMNGATLKLHEFAGSSALMIELNNTFDSHVINGIIEGDFYNHDYTNSPNSSEWVNGISMGGEAKYSSYENLTIKDITGYGTINGIKASRDGKLGYTYSVSSKGSIGDTFKLGDIDRTTGLDIASTNRTTCDFRDISGYSDIGYLSVSVYLGYQGNPCGTWNLVCHFYDVNKKFIKSTDAYQYRRVAVPSNAKFMRVTILNESYPTNLSIQLFRLPTHCSFKNLKLDNCRAVGMAPQGMNNMLFESCELSKCGSAVTKCALDAEDGWDMMQDATFRKLNFHDNPTNDFLTCAGHNFILEDSTCEIYIWGRTRNITIRNNILIGSRVHNDGLTKTGIPKIINNKLDKGLEFANSTNSISNSLIRDCNLSCCILNGIAFDCIFDIPSGYIDNIILNRCTLNNFGVYINNQVYMNNCIFNNTTNKSSLKFNTQSGYREFNNCTFNNTTSLAGNYFGKAIFNNCTFYDINLYANTTNTLNDLIFNKCTLSYSSDNFITLSSNVYVNFKKCTITEINKTNNKIFSLVYLLKEPTSGQAIFENCSITKNNGYILDGYYTPGYTNKIANYEIILNNSPVSIQLLSDKYKNTSQKLYIVTIN